MASCFWVIEDNVRVRCVRCKDILPGIDTTIQRECPIPGLGDRVKDAIAGVGLGGYHCDHCEQRKDLLDRLEARARQAVAEIKGYR